MALIEVLIDCTSRLTGIMRVNIKNLSIVKRYLGFSFSCIYRNNACSAGTKTCSFQYLLWVNVISLIQVGKLFTYSNEMTTTLSHTPHHHVHQKLKSEVR